MSYMASTFLIPRFSYLPKRVHLECEGRYKIIWLRKYYELHEKTESGSIFVRYVCFNIHQK